MFERDNVNPFESLHDRSFITRRWHEPTPINRFESPPMEFLSSFLRFISFHFTLYSSLPSKRGGKNFERDRFDSLERNIVPERTNEETMKRRREGRRKRRGRACSWPRDFSAGGVPVLKDSREGVEEESKGGIKRREERVSRRYRGDIRISREGSDKDGGESRR